jgi:hypothetical protein
MTGGGEGDIGIVIGINHITGQLVPLRFKHGWF